MKKYALLTSVFALAACGGGSDGGTVGFAPSDVTRIGTVTQAAANSNAIVTNMVSEIGVSADDADAPSINLGRAASGSFIHNNYKYDSYKLDDVNIRIGDWGIAKFVVDDKGRIDKIEFIDKDGEPAVNPVMVRQGDSDKFIVKFLDDSLNDSNRDVKFSYISYAKELGLQFSDFGVFTGKSPFSGNNVANPFVAGYEVKRIENPTGVMTFTGLAKGSVARHINDHDKDQETITDKNATLTFNNGDETIVADFDKWYKTTITKKSDGKFDLAFVENKTINENHKLHTLTADNINADDGNHKIEMETRYYGKNGDKNESVALINYYQFDKDNADDNVNVTFGFGGTGGKITAY